MIVQCPDCEHIGPQADFPPTALDHDDGQCPKCGTVSAGSTLAVCIPEQKKRQHGWILVATYGLSQSEAKGFTRGTILRLDKRDPIMTNGPGCVYCEGLYANVAGEQCPGRPFSDAYQQAVAAEAAQSADQSVEAIAQRAGVVLP